MQYQQLVRHVAQRLQAAGVEPYDYEARVLVAYAFDISMQELNRRILLRTEVSDAFADAATSACADTSACTDTSVHNGTTDTGAAQVSPLRILESIVQRRQLREPLQHIVGVAHFRYLQLQVGKGVFIPRPETEQLVQIGLDWIAEHPQQRTCSTHNLYTKSNSVRVVDLCAGSGAIGLSVVQECAHTDVWAVEYSDEAYAWTERNAQSVLGSDMQQVERYHLIHGDATDPAILQELNGTVDIVLTNPPYIPLSQPVQQPEVRDYDPHIALYGGSDDGLRIPVAIIERSMQLLHNGGLLVMEHDVSQGAALVHEALQVGFLHAHTVQDYTGRDRFLVAMR